MLALLRMGRGSCDEGKEGGRGLLVLTGLAVESSSSVMFCGGWCGWGVVRRTELFELERKQKRVQLRRSTTTWPRLCLW